MRVHACACVHICLCAPQGLKGVAVVQGVDVQSDEQVAGMAEALEGGGTFDVMVNNAGYFWEQEMLRVSCTGCDPVYPGCSPCIRAAAPRASGRRRRSPTCRRPSS